MINNQIKLIYILAFLIFSIQTFAVNFSTPYFIKLIKFNIEHLGYALTLMNLGSLIMGVLLYKIIDKFNYLLLLKIGLTLLLALFIFAYLNITSNYNIISLYVFYSFYGALFFSIQTLLYISIPLCATPGRLGSSMGGLNIFVCLPQLIMINVYAKLAISKYSNKIFLVVIICSSLALILSFYMQPRSKN